MAPRPARREHTPGWWLSMLALAAWFVLAMYDEYPDLAMSVLRSGHRASTPLILLLALPSGLASLAWPMMAAWMTTHRPIARGRVIARVGQHLAAAAALGGAAVLARMLERAPLAIAGGQLAVARDIHVFLATAELYAVFAGLAHAVEYARRYRQKEAAELRLQVELSRAELERTEAELRMLKMQLNPHFLFNSLNALSLLIASQPRAAERMVVELAELLRRAMHSVATQEVALVEEVAGLLPFVEIEQLRLGGGLTVEWEIAPETEEALVPHMLLQPLVENAIKHGIGPAGGRGVLRIGATREGAWLTLTVADDGVGLATGALPRHAAVGGIGSANLVARLTELYGAQYHFELRPAPRGGTLAVVRVPWHEEPISLPARRFAAPRAGADEPAAARPGKLHRSPGLSRTELALAVAWLVYRWRSSYELRSEEARALGNRMRVPIALASSGLTAFVWAAGLLAAFRLARTHPISRDEWRQSLPVHVAAAVALGIAAYVARLVGRMGPGYTGSAIVPDRPILLLVSMMLVYGVYAGLAHAVEYARRYRQKEAAELRLQVELSRAELERTEAELRMLKMQLNPHFLFNSLNALSLLIASQPRAAERMVVELAELLRRAMHSVATQEVALVEEVAGLLPFVEIEQLRLGGGLTVEWEIAPETEEALVPHMLLQPLVENAIKHGIGPAGGRGVLRIGATREGAWLTLTVADDGVGLATGALPRRDAVGGIGSANLVARLTELYGAQYHFELRPAAERGTLAVVRVPWHEEPVQLLARPSALAE